jgi:hypothetical protein
MPMRSIVWIAMPMLLLAGCANLDYMGESYPPTQHVDVYYSEQNVPREYHVMGEILATAELMVSTSDLQAKMVKKAQENGADAVVLLGLEHYQSGSTTNWDEASKEKTNKKGTTTTGTSGNSTTTVEEKKKIRALFVKYKPAAAATARPDSTH